jgi:hypothetical protein
MTTPRNFGGDELPVSWKSEHWTPAIVYRAETQNAETHSHKPRFEFKPGRGANRGGDTAFVVKWGTIQARQ